MRIYFLILLSLTFLYAQDDCTDSNVICGCTDIIACDYNPEATLDSGCFTNSDDDAYSNCEDGTTGCDCNNECGGSAFQDGCSNCVGGKTIYTINHFKDECGICGYQTAGPGPQVLCCDASYQCNSIDCPFCPDDCPDGTTGTPDGTLYSNICVPTDFSSVFLSSKQAFYYIESVTIDGAQVEADDWVGAFNGNVCVGARQWDTSECGGGVCDVPVMGVDFLLSEETEGYIQPGEIPAFQIYDASANMYYDAQVSDDISWTDQALEQIYELKYENPLSIYDQITPDTYSIYNIYPNPFNPITNIEYSLLENADIELFVYNIHGKHIQTLVQGFQTAGYHSINWNASNYPSSIYFIRLESGAYSKTQKVVLFK